jgi:predicted oxidoreductase
MQNTSNSSQPNFSRIIHGHWRLLEWNLSPQALLTLVSQAMELGISTIDQADIYGDYSCEAMFGEALAIQPGLRKYLQLVSKCGIKLMSEKFPERQIKHYDYSKKYIIQSVENSLSNLHTDYLDVLLLHRPSPFFNTEEVAETFSELKQSGKVLHFGVSNFLPHQMDLLNSFLRDSLVTNQVEISPFCLDYFQNGTVEMMQKNQVSPMAWSPLAGGKLMNPQDEKGNRIFKSLQGVAHELNEDSIEKVVYTWLMKHPSKILPVVGTGKIERLKLAVEAQELEMSLEQWFKIYVAGLGDSLP